MTSEGSFARDQCLLRRGEIRELRIADFLVVQIERFEGLLWARQRWRSAGEFQTAQAHCADWSLRMRFTSAIACGFWWAPWSDGTMSSLSAPGMWLLQ